MARIACLVAFGDWVTKAVATWAVEGELVVNEKLRFAVVHNDVAAFGLSIGAYTWQVNLAVTLAAILFMIPVSRDLARIDAAAPRALGLIMGGALGNLFSLVTSPQGVVDFISVSMGASSELVLNVADLAAYIGLARILRTGFLIAVELRKAAKPLAARYSVTKPAWRNAFTEREVPLPVLAAADSPESMPAGDPTPRPESVRRAELADMTDPKVIDIRPHLAHRTERLADGPLPGVEPRV
jgi:lipoprotein signal peptidase